MNELNPPFKFSQEKFNKKSILFSIFAMFLFAGCAAIQDFGAYKDGVEISAAQMDQIKVGKNKMSDVERIVGYHSAK